MKLKRPTDIIYLNINYQKIYCNKCSEIFYDVEDTDSNYYGHCPHCGCMCDHVTLGKGEWLSKGIVAVFNRKIGTFVITEHE